MVDCPSLSLSVRPHYRARLAAPWSRLLSPGFCVKGERRQRKSCIERAHEFRRSLGAFDHDQIIVLPLEAGCGKVRAVGVPDQRRPALISVRLPDREIGSTDFNDGLAMTNEGAEGVLGADQLKAALAPICAKKFQRSHDSSRTT